LSEIKPDEGKLVDFENEKIAVYKSKAGKIFALNPVCTHAKCIVNFNAEEKSWDCPCHGGRFDLDGKVLTGPPRHDLQKIDLTK
jgi:Rieske Fe-S protein